MKTKMTIRKLNVITRKMARAISKYNKVLFVFVILIATFTLIYGYHVISNVYAMEFTVNEEVILETDVVITTEEETIETISEETTITTTESTATSTETSSTSMIETEAMTTTTVEETTNTEIITDEMTVIENDSNEEAVVEDEIIYYEENVIQEEETITEAVNENAVVEENNVEETNPDNTQPEEIIDTTTTVENETACTEEVTESCSEQSISESDYILICNCVAHEAGANNIPAYDKALVVEVIMNRVNSPNYPDTVYGVITQPYQFSGSSNYTGLTDYSSKVTDLVKESVDLYLSDPSSFDQGYLSFTGDGKRNYFR